MLLLLLLLLGARDGDRLSARQLTTAEGALLQLLIPSLLLLLAARRAQKGLLQGLLLRCGCRHQLLRGCDVEHARGRRSRMTNP